LSVTAPAEAQPSSGLMVCRYRIFGSLKTQKRRLFMSKKYDKMAAEFEAAKYVNYNKLLVESGVWLAFGHYPDAARRNRVEVFFEKEPKSKPVYMMLLTRIWAMIQKIEQDCIAEHGTRPDWQRIGTVSLSKAIKRAIRRQRRTGGALVVEIENAFNFL